MSCSSVAVLLFTRSAGQEGAHKRFMSRGGRAANAAIGAQLIAHAEATARQAGLGFVCVDSSQQTGSSFGERLAGAVRYAFGLGYSHLLIIGNDCPQLDAPRLQQAAAAVQATGAVLGPATDGGVYLLGLARENYAAVPWLSLPWQTAYLGAALAGYLRQFSTIVRLPLLADIDDEQGLARALRLPLARLLRLRLQRLRASKAPALATAQACPLREPAIRPHRGPPAN